MECSICLDDICVNTNNMITECGHRFHTSCIMKHAAYNGFNCPNCRAEMAEEPDLDDESDDYEDDGDSLGTFTFNRNADYAMDGMRWLFQRAEGQPIDDIVSYFDDEEDEYEIDMRLMYERGFSQANDDHETYIMDGIRWMFQRAQDQPIDYVQNLTNEAEEWMINHQRQEQMYETEIARRTELVLKELEKIKALTLEDFVKSALCEIRGNFVSVENTSHQRKVDSTIDSIVNRLNFPRIDIRQPLPTAV